MLSRQQPTKLTILAATLDPVSTKNPSDNQYAAGSQCAQTVVPDRTFDAMLMNSMLGSLGTEEAAPLEVLIIPGGRGVRDAATMEPVIKFVKGIAPRVRYIVTVCTGSAIAAQAEVLDDRRATTNKLAFDWVQADRPQVQWIRKARWVVDQGEQFPSESEISTLQRRTKHLKVWTSSGVSAGIDAMFDFVERVYGKEVADDIAMKIEYVRNGTWDDDPFA